MSDEQTSPLPLIDQLRRRQVESWQSGQQTKVEELLHEIAPETLEEDQLLELIYGEICLSDQQGVVVSVAAFADRFPELRDRITRLFEMHEEFERDDASGEALANSPENEALLNDNPGHDRLSMLEQETVTPSTDIQEIATGEGSPSAATKPPQRVSNYEIVDTIGQGGMGVVLKAKQPGADRFVALKMISTNVSDSMVRRFHAEVRAAARLEHPSIVPVYDVGEHNGLPFFTMALIEGKNLKQRLADQQRMRGREAASLVRTLANAVAFAHERGVIHRDLKPANVLIDANEKPWLTDFGIAKRMDVDEGNTTTGQILGTSAYMAPEQISKPDSITAGTDVYGLGAILYECLTGRVLFDGADVLSVLAKVQTQAPRPPREIYSEIDSGLQAICLRCLEKEPGDRYASARALAEELERYLRGEPTLVAPLSTLHSIRRVLRQRNTEDRLSSSRVGKWHSAMHLLIHSTVFVLVATNQHVGWLWLTLFVGIAILMTAHRRYYYSRYWQLHSVERQSALVVISVGLAFATLIWIHSPGWNGPIRDFLSFYPPFAIVFGVATISLAFFSGKWILYGFVYFLLAAILHAFPFWSPLVFGVAGALLLTLAHRDIQGG